MSLQNLLADGLLRKQQTSAQEIQGIWSVIVRDLHDAEAQGMSHDGQFHNAYNAARQLCKLMLRAEGYRTAGSTGEHRLTLQILPLILGAQKQSDADYLDSCRNKRNRGEYDYAGSISKIEAEELIKFSHELRDEVLVWLKAKHPKLVPSV
jgi:hypothetical protein